MLNKNHWLIVSVILLLLPAVTTAQSSRRLSVEQLDQKIQLLERKLQAMSDLVTRVDLLQREVQQLRGELEVQSHSMENLKNRQRDLYLDVDQRLNQLSQGSAGSRRAPGVTPPAGNGEPPAPVTTASGNGTSPAGSQEPPADAVAQDPAAEEAAYRAAFELLRQRRYPEAREAFRSFMAKYPQGSYADNAQYWLAESSYVTRDFDVALADFQKVLADYPASSKVPDAMLKTSFIQYEKKQWAEARTTLEELINRYPDATASRLAAERLKRMQSEGR